MIYQEQIANHGGAKGVIYRMKRNRHGICGGVLLLCFIVFTILVKTIDVQPIGPEGAAVGFAVLNSWVRGAIGVHLWWYELTEYLGLLSIAAALGFAVLGLIQLFKRRDIRKVDREFLWLGAFYAATAGIYALFEKVAINCRPVILDEGLEASYPSTHTMLTIFVMSTAILQLERLLREKKTLRRWAVGICAVLMAATVVGRVIAGVHWATDIVGGILIAAGLLELYRSVTEK